MKFVRDLFFTANNFLVIATAGLIIGLPIWAIVLIGGIVLIPKIGVLVLMGMIIYALYLSIGVEKELIVWLFYGGLVLQTIQFVAHSIYERIEKKRQEKFEKLMISMQYPNILDGFEARRNDQ